MTSYLWSFVKKIFFTKTRITTSFLSLAFLLIALPGQNDWQLLQLHPSTPPVTRPNITLPPASAYPVAKPEAKLPFVSAYGVYLMDSRSGSILYAKNPDAQLLPASTTKIMTAATAIDTYPLNDIVEIQNEDRSVGHTAELYKGEKLTVEQLLYALLVSSGNDAALALAQNYPSGYADFVEAMNQKANYWHLTNTQYKNVSGVEQAGHFSSARDLSLLTKEMLKNPTFAKIVATPQYSFISLTGQTHHLTNLNQLLGEVDGLKGVKTGWTERAGECLVTATERNGHEIIAVVLNSQDRFSDSRLLINWTFANHEWKSVLN